MKYNMDFSRNCAGYALGIEDWVTFNDNYNAERIVEELKGKYNLKEIKNLEEAPKDSIVILFRLGENIPNYWIDFHFIKYFTKSKVCVHKPGCGRIERISSKDILTKEWGRTGDLNKYNGKIYMFIKEG